METFIQKASLKTLFFPYRAKTKLFKANNPKATRQKLKIFLEKQTYWQLLIPHSFGFLCNGWFYFVK